MGKLLKRHYTLEFKQQAVRLSEEMGSVSRAARQLGLSEANVHNWKSKAKLGKLKDSNNNMSVIEVETVEEEIKRLRKENKELKDVNYILKRAAAFFSQDHIK